MRLIQENFRAQLASLSCFLLIFFSFLFPSEPSSIVERGKKIKHMYSSYGLITPAPLFVMQLKAGQGT